MKPQSMLVIHDPDNGQFGDCFRACIASLLEVKSSTVPHVLHDYTPDSDSEIFMSRMNAWLAQRGLKFIEFPLDGDYETAQQTAKRFFADVHYLLLGKSPRGEFNHNVICLNGEIVHDPATDGGTLDGPVIGDDYYWIGFLVKV